MRALALALAALLALAGTARAEERCGLLCNEELTLEGAEAGARLEGWLGQPLPAGARVEHLIEGGFQDTYLRARLAVDAEGLARVLAAAGLTPSALAPVETAEAGIEEPDWWDWKLRAGVKSAEGSLPAMPYATLYAAPVEGEPGRWTLYLWAFQT